jgi:hypothetical protein
MINPDHMAHWMKMMAYGAPTPGTTDTPTHHRSSTLEQAKKAILWVTPNKNLSRDVRSNSDNTSKSITVNDVIKDIKKAEVKKQDQTSQAKQNMKRDEYRKKHCSYWRLRLGTLICRQSFHQC